MPLRRAVQRALRRTKRTPIDWGDLRRTTPFSDVYGFDRGTPIDRFFIGHFLKEHEGDIAGHVLEVGAPEYASAVGRGRVASIDILDIDPLNPEATIIADLSEAESIPSERFDCFILTQTLQYVSDVGTAISNAVRSLVPGGVLLLSVPVTSRLDPTAGLGNDLWRFTPAGLKLLLSESIDGADVTITSFGNVLTSVAFFLGLSAEELRGDELSVIDEAFPLVVCARVKRGA
jgi:SAM-dependent methyltransferase